MSLRADDFLWSEAKNDPWPHCVMYPALPWELYEALEREFPAWERIVGNRPLKPNARYDVNAADSLRDQSWPLIWREFVARHVTQELWETYTKVFSLPYVAKAGVRNRDNTSIVMECQFGVNTPSDVESRVRGPHVDNPVEIIGGLLYMPDDDAGGDLLIYRHKGNPKFVGKAELEDDRCEIVGSVPYRANQAVFFVNTVNSVHGVTPRKPSSKPRRLVNFCAEARYPLFELPR